VSKEDKLNVWDQDKDPSLIDPNKDLGKSLAQQKLEKKLSSKR